MCWCRRGGWCGRTGYIIPRRRTPSPSAARCWGSRRWRRRWPWTGRRCVRSAAIFTRNGVPLVDKCWCAPGSSRVGVRRRWRWRGSARPAGDLPGDRRAGAWCACRLPRGGAGTGGDSLRQPAGALGRPESPVVHPSAGPMRRVTGKTAEGQRGGNSIARVQAPLVRPGRYAVRPTRG